uniref:Golgi to er traffic protein 4 n=1 Tax=Tetraselmis sp. GSL018 TaxID=582737 RepID=A0A061S2K2_9CHLO|mmetsp:Transcript_37323/g.88710  ORF Transcript_37323/g.88710 Transcript_37323/m.88710 type:complete len:327 (-) Transcript_37323:15-995(-)|eukprot:CAMPEP_0177608798 /NCGR_PEP_ID=MMETSP0419_2-20121207/18680_1 /TAXON_ID=582737 /ORGANISM="Tetraselmis sp., Strain GSL018" /LENGTH=326 /DNA_ID=CAMNT_0019103545 /DNA_START=88 /DNA_END=1068 /DNA_ORIENTATION=-
MSQRSTNIDKTLSKLRTSVAEGAFYEAQQMFKTVYARYRNKKAREDSYKLAEEGAILQLREGQLTCGIELAMLLVESYIEDSAAATQESLDRLLSVHSAFPEPETSAVPVCGRVDNAADGTGTASGWPVKECVKFLMSGVKWIKRCGTPEQSQLLHRKAADYIWKCLGWQGFGWATTHYIRGDSMESFAAALISCMAEGRADEEDLFISRACLQILAVATPGRAAEQLESCEVLLGAISVFRGGLPLPETPLMHFTTFLLKALKANSRELEQMLREKYAPALERDPMLETLIARVEQVYLGIEPPSRGGMGELIGDLMRGLFSAEL